MFQSHIAKWERQLVKKISMFKNLDIYKFNAFQLSKLE